MGGVVITAGPTRTGERLRLVATTGMRSARRAAVLLAAAPAGLLLSTAVVLASYAGGDPVWGLLLALVVLLIAGRSDALRAAERRRLHVDPSDPARSHASWRDEPAPAPGRRVRSGPTPGVALSTWTALRLVAATVGAAALSAAAVCFGVAVGAVVVDGLVESGPWSSRAGWASLWMLPVAATILVLAVGITLALAHGLAALAPVLLAPTAAERVDAAERRARHVTARNHLARELHDTIGHTLTVTAVQASAARRLLEASPEPDRERLLNMLATIETTSRDATADLDDALATLRDPADRADARPGDRRPVPTLADLDRLLDRVRAAGLSVAAAVTGDPRTLPTACSAEAYRLVQEGLTNVLRHAGTVPTTLTVTVGEDGLTVAVENVLRGAVPPAVGGIRGRRGRGLVGARERITALGGTLHATATGDAWVLRAHLPRRGPNREGSSR